jgi:transposase-like protein
LTDIHGFALGHAEMISVRQGSIFEGLKTSMTKYFTFLFMWCKDRQSQDVAQENDLNKNTLTSWNLSLRETIQDHLIENRDLLGGHDEHGRSKIVEIDESLFFRRKYNRGRDTGASWVFGMIERGSTKCAFFPVLDRSAATLLPLIRDNCLPGTTIISDCWAAYNALSQDETLEHRQVNHRYNFVSPDDPMVHTQNIENCWSHSKRASRNQCGVKKNDLEGLLYEFAFKKKFPRHKRVNQLIIIFSDMLRE